MELSVKEVPERLRFNPEALRSYLAAHLPGFQCVQHGLRVKQFSNGQSNPTYLLQPTSGQEYVLRRRPPGKLLPGAHRVSWQLSVRCCFERGGAGTVTHHTLHSPLTQPHRISTALYVFRLTGSTRSYRLCIELTSLSPNHSCIVGTGLWLEPSSMSWNVSRCVSWCQ